MHQVFIEVADEITTVIERLKAAPEKAVALVVPKGAVLLQSVVNLKLAKKAASDAGKTFTLITTDKIGRNLASQIGIATATNLDEIGAIEQVSHEPKIIAGVKIHRYYEEEPDLKAPEAAAAPIIPKPLLQENKPTEEKAPEPEPEEELSPIAVRPIKTDDPTVVAAAAPAVELISRPHKTVAAEPELIDPNPPPVATRKNPSRRVLSFVVFVLILLLLGGGAISTLYLPKTVVTVHVPAEPWSKQLDSGALVSEPIKGTDRLTTASVPSVEPTETLDFKASGSKDVGNTATGTVDILNYQNSDPQTLASGAQITASGRTFVTTAPATVPGFRRTNGTDIPGSVTVAVSATTAGEAGNVNTSSAAITSPTTQLTARNLTTTGGTSKTVTVVTDTDIANAKAALTQQLDTDTLTQLNQKEAADTANFGIPDNDHFVMEDFSTDVHSGDQASGGKATGKALRKRLVISLTDLKTSMTAIGQSESKSGTSFTLGDVKVTNLQSDPEQGTATYTVQVTGHVTQTVDLSVVRKQILGKSTGSVTDIIRSIIPDALVDIKQSPAWWPIKKVPYNPQYLTVQAKNE